MLQVFYVHQLKAGGVFPEQLHRVLTGVGHPQNVHLETDVLRICILHDVIKQGAPAVRLELKAVVMVAEGQPLPAQGGSGPVKISHCLPGLFQGKRCLVRNPRHADIPGAQGPGNLRHLIGFADQFVVAGAVGSTHHAPFVEQRFQLLRRFAEKVGKFNVGQAQGLYLVKGARHIVFKTFPERVGDHAGAVRKEGRLRLGG